MITEIFMIKNDWNFCDQILQSVVALLWYGKKRVTTLELLVTSWKLKSKSGNSKVRVQIHELRVQIHELRVQIHELRVQIHKLRAQIHEFKNNLINENLRKQP